MSLLTINPFVPRDGVEGTPAAEFAADSLGRPAAFPSVQGAVEKCEIGVYDCGDHSG